MISFTTYWSFSPVLICLLRKPKTRRSKRFLEGRAPKLSEDVKSVMIMKGGNTNQIVTQALKDIVSQPATNDHLILIHSVNSELGIHSILKH